MADAPLELPGVLADQEGHVLLEDEVEGPVQRPAHLGGILRPAVETCENMRPGRKFCPSLAAGKVLWMAAAHLLEGASAAVALPAAEPAAPVRVPPVAAALGFRV